jgi:hypothetical protein
LSQIQRKARQQAEQQARMLDTFHAQAARARAMSRSRIHGAVKSALHAEDSEHLGRSVQPGTSLIVSDRIEDAGHALPEAWLRSRVRGWMNLVESPDLDYWIGSYTADGKWIYCSSNKDTWGPQPYRQEYARKVVAHLNRTVSAGGAWLAGWIRGGRMFYLLWKDADGDLKCPIECDKPFVVLRNYTVADWERMATVALGVTSEWEKNMEYGKGQQVKRAQGERPSEQHLAEAAKVVPT